MREFLERILAKVRKERIRQDGLWGEQNHSYFSEYGKPIPGTIRHTKPSYASMAQAFKYKNALAVGRGTVGWDTILLEEVMEALEQAELGDDDRYEQELVEVMAVACAMIEANQRRRAANNG